MSKQSVCYNKRMLDSKKTLSSLKQYNESLYYLDWYGDVDIDYLLSYDISRVLKYVRKSRKIIKNKRAYIRYKSKFGCSTFSFHNADNEHLLARNFDYPPSPCLVVKTHPSKGFKTIGIADLNVMLFGYKKRVLSKKKNKNNLLLAPYVVMDGMNEKGLVVSVLQLTDKITKQKTGKRKIITPLAIRAILEKCSSVEEAIKFLESHDMTSSILSNYHFQIIDKNTSVLIEYVNNKMILYRENEWPNQCLTNFYITEGANNKDTNGTDRYEIIVKALKKHKTFTNEEAFDVLDKIKQNYRLKIIPLLLKCTITTCWGAIYNTNKLTMSVVTPHNEAPIEFKIDMDK